jgi:hypothetical protein
LNILKKEEGNSYFIVFVDDNIRNIKEVTLLKDVDLKEEIKKRRNASIYGTIELLIPDIIKDLEKDKIIKIPEKETHKFIISNLKKEID